MNRELFRQPFGPTPLTIGKAVARISRDNVDVATVVDHFIDVKLINDDVKLFSKHGKRLANYS